MISFAVPAGGGGGGGGAVAEAGGWRRRSPVQVMRTTPSVAVANATVPAEPSERVHGSPERSPSELSP